MSRVRVLQWRGYFPARKGVTHLRPTTKERWLKSIAQLLVLDYLDTFGRRWSPDDGRRLRRLIDEMRVRVAANVKMAECDATVEYGGPKILMTFSERPSCSWYQLIAHEVAHVFDYVRSGDGVTHSKDFFTFYRRLLNCWFAATETVQFVAYERITCAKKEVPTTAEAAPDDSVGSGPV